MIVNQQLANSSGVQQKDLWGTEQSLFNALDKEYEFSLDPCCLPDTAKCHNYFTPKDDGLAKSWSWETVYMNPPYSRGNIDKWVKKAYNESRSFHTRVVALIPVSASATWWHDYVVGKGEIVYIKGRVKFEGAESTAPFSSALIFYGIGFHKIPFNVELKRGREYKLNYSPTPSKR